VVSINLYISAAIMFCDILEQSDSPCGTPVRNLAVVDVSGSEKPLVVAFLAQKSTQSETYDPVRE
jgi:hypothetical protein